MSNNDSLDEETKRILAEVNPDDSKESKKEDKKNKAGYNIDDDGFETNDMESPDSEW